MKEFDLEKYSSLALEPLYKKYGKVVNVVGLTIESVGPDAKLNDLCRIIIDKENGTSILAEVVGFRDKRLLLMPFENAEGIGVGCIVENTGHPLSVLVGDELLGHTVDGVGRRRCGWSKGSSSKRSNGHAHYHSSCKQYGKNFFHSLFSS